MLTKAERQYCTTRKELLAVVTFTKQYRPYIIGQQFPLRTDHNSLSRLQTFREPQGQLARWLEQLQEFNFTIVHRRGRNTIMQMPCPVALVASVVETATLDRKSWLLTPLQYNRRCSQLNFSAMPNWKTQA